MPKKNISYTEAITEIEEIINKIEQDELDVDQLTDRVKRVAALLKICKSKLHETEEEVENILKDMDDKDN